MMPFSLFLALKYLRPKRSFVSVVTTISVLGVVIGVAILVIVLSVMTGFDNMWREKILSFKPHLTVSCVNGIIEEDEAISRRIEKVPGITGVSPAIECLTLVQHKDRALAPYVIGLDPDRALNISRVPEFMHIGKFDISYGNIVVGRDFAISMRIHVDDKLLVYSPQNVMSKDELYLPEELTVSGIFDMGMSKFDGGFLITSLETVRDLTGLEGGARAIYVMTEDAFQIDQFVDKVRNELDHSFYVSSWKEEDRMLFDALSHEKTMMFVLLVFITVVAIFCVTNTIIVITVQKTNEIGLLKALGFPSRKIMAAFVWHGWIQCLTGVLLGLGFGLLVLHNLRNIVRFLAKFNIEAFPKGIYGLAEIPWSTSPGELFQIALFVMVFCTLSSFIPAYRAARLDPVKALRHE